MKLFAYLTQTDYVNYYHVKVSYLNPQDFPLINKFTFNTKNKVMKCNGADTRYGLRKNTVVYSLVDYRQSFPYSYLKIVLR